MQTRVKRHTAKLLILALWCCFPRVINNSTQIPPASFHPQKLCPLPASYDEQKNDEKLCSKNKYALSPFVASHPRLRSFRSSSRKYTQLHMLLPCFPSAG